MHLPHYPRVCCTASICPTLPSHVRSKSLRACMPCLATAPNAECKYVPVLIVYFLVFQGAQKSSVPLSSPRKKVPSARKDHSNMPQQHHQQAKATNSTPLPIPSPGPGATASSKLPPPPPPVPQKKLYEELKSHQINGVDNAFGSPDPVYDRRKPPLQPPSAAPSPPVPSKSFSIRPPASLPPNANRWQQRQTAAKPSLPLAMGTSPNLKEHSDWLQRNAAKPSLPVHVGEDLLYEDLDATSQHIELPNGKMHPAPNSNNSDSSSSPSLSVQLTAIQTTLSTIVGQIGELQNRQTYFEKELSALKGCCEPGGGQSMIINSRMSPVEVNQLVFCL